MAGFHSRVSQLRVLVAGGGTGGHVYPGIAIAKEIKKRRPQAEVLFVGTEHGVESRIVPREGFALQKITVSGLKGVRGLSRLRGLLEIPRSLWESHKILQRFQPNIVIGVGGYSSGPPVLMAWLRGIPTLLQEQNVFPGLTNRLLARVTKKVATAFRESERFFGKKAVLTGNPIRADFRSGRLSRTREAEVRGSARRSGDLRGIDVKPRLEKFVLLIFGGSQGAHALNQSMVEALPLLQHHFSDMIFMHQTGDKDYDWVLGSYQSLGAVSDVRPFFEDLPAQFARTDLVLSRAGATTLAEITVAGKAAILVPFPFATDNHQQKNAEALVAAGAAEMILQKDLTGEGLANRIEYFYSHREELRHMEQRSLELGRPDSTERIVDLVEALANV